MSVEFKVTPSALAELSQALLTLKGEFEGMEDYIGRYESAVAHGRVKDKLGGFADNWSDRRREVLKKLDEVASYADVAAQAYSEAETQLSAHYDESASATAAAFTPSSSSGSGDVQAIAD
jgi:hypothetical protein